MQWTIFDDSNYVDSKMEYVPPIRPDDSKLFSKDIFLYDKSTESIKITYSNVRSGIPISGILLLEKNKTFGRTPNKKRLLYKCIPDDKQLPAFLIPYDQAIHFSKIVKNKFVLFKFDNWNSQHPHGILLETIGDVDHLESFYEYQLHCKSLHSSLTNFTKKTREQLQIKPEDEYILQIMNHSDFKIEDRTSHKNIFSIDPENSLDFDDAFSIDKTQDNYKISIYIANVYFWLETLNLWKSFSNRVSTIYLPDRKRPMLPTILSDNLCSLKENCVRFAFVMDIEITPTGEIIRTEYKNAAIKVARNYSYESADLLYNNPDYQTLFSLTRILDKHTKDTHDLVAFWMIKMNALCGTYMHQSKIGIYRTANYVRAPDESDDSNTNIDTLDPDTKRVITMWNNISGQYILYDKNIEISHDFLKKANYIHITSPIRRLVDLLNQFILTIDKGLTMNPSKDAMEFVESWLKRIDYINASMRSIRKIQTDCELLHRCHKQPNIMTHSYDGILFDKIRKNDGSFVYMVYLPKLKLLSRLKTYVELPDYSQRSFRIYLFAEEHSLKKKIRVKIV